MLYGEMKKIITIIAIIAALLGTLGCYPEDGDPITYEVVALTNRASLEGTFFLASGYMKEELYFYAYIRKENGAIVLEMSKAKYAEIYEEDRDDAILIKYRYAFYAGRNQYIDHQYYVPKGTVIRGINLDLKDIR